MIALLRRLRDSAREVRASDWMLVAVEGGLVFVGIVAAFQLEQWATDRREAAQVDRLMERLLDETADALALFEARANQMSDLLDGIEPAAVAMSDGRCPASLGSLEMLQLGAWYDQPGLPVYEELVNGVGLSALPSQLHGVLSRYRYQLDYMRDQFGSDQQVEPLFTDDDVNITREYVPRPKMANSRDLTSEETARLPQVAVRKYDVASLCARPGFRERYLEGAFKLEGYLAIRNDTVVLAANACHALATFVGKPCYDRARRKIDKRSRLRIDDMLNRFYNRRNIPQDERWSERAPR